MGVGAAMAAGSHLEKGVWALFVIAAVMIRIEVKSERVENECVGIQIVWCIRSAIDKRIRASPIRLVRAVIIPAASDLLFW